MKNRFCCLITAILLPVVGITAKAISPALEKLPQMRPLKESASNLSSAEVGTVELDSQIYNNCAADFSDLRLAGSDNIEIPYIVQKETISEKKIIRQNCFSKILSLKKNENNCYEIIVELKNREITPAEAVFITPCQNYEKTVSVYGSNDLTLWKTLAEKSAIYDYSQIVDLKNNTVSFRQDNFKYYKFTIDNFTELKKSPTSQLIIESKQGNDYRKTEKNEQTTTVFQISDINLNAYAQTESSLKNKTISYKLSSFVQEPDSRNNKNDVITIQTLRQPLTQIVIFTQSTNFSRTFTLQGCDDNKWIPITTGKISNITLGSFKKEELVIDFPERRFKSYRILINNGDSPPIQINKIELMGNVYCTKFIVPSQEHLPLSLFFGSEKITAPAYDLETVLAKAPISQFRSFYLSVPQANPWFKPEKKENSWFTGKHFFGGAIALMVIILAWVLFRGIKKIESLPDGQ